MSWPEPRHHVGLDLGQVVEVALADPADAGDVDPAEVVEREDDAAAAGNPIGAVRAQPRRDRRRAAEHRPADGPGDVIEFTPAARSRTSDSIRSTTSSTSRLVVSISIASGAGCMRVASFSSRIRRSVASASVADAGPLGHAPLRPHFAIGDEVDLHLGSGATTVPMSRPSITTFAVPPELALSIAHDLAHRGGRATTGTIRSTRSRESRPSRRCRRSRRGRPRRTVTGCSRASSASASASPRSSPRFIASHVSARYIAPVSR